MQAFITKFALTQGILEKDGEVNPDYHTMFCEADRRWSTPYHKPFWHLTHAEAVIHAETMRKQKIASLKKQIKKLEGLSFEKEK